MIRSAVKVKETWIDLGAVEDVPLRGARRIVSSMGDIAIFRTGDGDVFALLDRCPHKGGPLSQGIVHGKAVACPLHNWRIDLASGEPLDSDAGKGCAPRFSVRIENGRILLSTDI
ncbi:MAG: nitrite reductase small subunit NirD [Caulobacterales bacterium]